MGKDFKDRKEAEHAEDLKTISNDAPAEKFQTEQQVAKTDDALAMKTPESSFDVERQNKKGLPLKQTVASRIITGGAYSGDSGMGISANGRAVSGTGGGVLGSANSTPVASKSRSQSRVGKKFDRLATKLNFTPNEQILVDYDESKPLADSADQDQGFNGTYRNEFARSQKVSGAVPGDLMFDRSVDFIFKDELYHESGQTIFQNNTRSLDNDMPTQQVEPGGDYPTVDSDMNYEVKTGAFINRKVNFQLTKDGKVANISFDTTDITVDDLSPEEANKASVNRLIHQNAIELDRETMDTKAGDEKADIWTPLARAVKQPTQVNALLRDWESECGAYVYLAYIKASTAMSFQLNRAKKDGQIDVEPGVESIIGSLKEYSESSSYTNDYPAMYNCFNKADYKIGSPALMIAAYDSTPKYNNKADLLLQPRGFRMHLQTADNNINTFRINKRLVQIINSKECFSTIDRDYDGMLPICMTDKAGLIDRHNFNDIGGFMQNHYILSFTSSNVERSYKYDNFTIIPKGLTKDGSTLYIYVKAVNSDGLLYDSATGIITLNPDTKDGAKTIDFGISFFDVTPKGYTKLATLTDSQSMDVIFHVPYTQNYSNTVITASDFNMSIDSTRLYPYHAGSYTYAYSDLRNRYILEVKHPLIEGLVRYLEDSIGSKWYSLLGDGSISIPMTFSTQFQTLWQLLICAATPFINKVRINSMRDLLYYEKNVGEYPYSELISLKETPTKNFMNFEYEDYDHPLNSKIMDKTTALSWIMPELITTLSKTKSNNVISDLKVIMPWYFNEGELLSNGTVNEDASCMSYPSIRSGIRFGFLDNFYSMSEKDVRLSIDRLTSYFLNRSNLGVYAYKYGRTTDGQPVMELSSGISIMDILSAPRELGWSLDAPSGFLTPIADGVGLRELDNDEGGLHSSFRIKFWTNSSTSSSPEILAADGVNINRAANFKQSWHQVFADEHQSGDRCGLVFGANDVGATGDTFEPIAQLGTGAQITGFAQVNSDQRQLWTRLQKLPFCLSPFDNDVQTAGVTLQDPLDILYMFGLAGFRASDYRESVYNREKELINQGHLFINDPWVQVSPLFREGSKATGISVSEGYELKQK